MVVFSKYFWRTQVLWDKEEKHLTQLNCDKEVKNE